MASTRPPIGGGVGTNQYQTKGSSIAGEDASRARTAGIATAVMEPEPSTDEELSRDEFLIPEQNMDALRKSLERLKKRADRIGVPAPTMEVIDQVEETEGGRVHLSYRVRVRGEAPKYNGWRFVAVVDLDPDDDSDLNVVGAVPGEVIDPEWRSMKERCDHCRVNNRGRKKLVVAEHDDGTRQVVGSTCLRDFLGHTSPQGIAAWAEIMSSLDQVVGGHCGYNSDDYDPTAWRYSPEDYMAWVAREIRLHGWTSRGQAYESDVTATANLAVQHMTAHEHEREDWGVSDPTDEDYETARKAMEWAQEIELGRSDYLDNLAAVAQKTSYRWKDVGIAASMITAYERAVERETRGEAQQRVRAASKHVGKVGERMPFSGEVTNCYTYPSAFGDKSIIEITGDDGNIYVWKTTALHPDRGDRLEGTIGIKAHETYRGTAQTLIKNPRFK